MRIDSTRGDRGWFVYSCEDRQQIMHTVWCDDQTARFTIGRIVKGQMEVKLFQAKKIAIVRGARVVLINPPDGNPEVIALEIREMLTRTTVV